MPLQTKEQLIAKLTKSAKNIKIVKERAIQNRDLINQTEPNIIQSAQSQINTSSIFNSQNKR